MPSIVAAALGLAVVILIPGIALLFLLGRKQMPWWEALAVVPAVGLGFVYVVAEIGSAAGSRFDVPTFTVATGVLLAVTGVVAFRRSKRSDEPRFERPRRSEYAGLALLTIAIVIGGSIWATGLRGVEVPPNFDAAHHGLFTAQIDRFETIDADRVLVASNGDTEPVVFFYPLGLHAASSLVDGPTPTTIADIWLALAAIFGAVVFPLGIYALTRVLFPRVPLAAGFAALLVPTVALFPYKPLAWGGIALIGGLAMLPGVVVAAAGVLTLPPNIRRSALAAVALVGLFATHSSELPVAIVLTLIVASMSLRSMETGVWLKRVFANGAFIGAVSFVLLGPVAQSVLRGGTQRAGFDDKPLVPLDPTIRALVNLSAFTDVAATALVAFAGIGAVIAVVRRTALLWLAAGAAMVGLFIATSVTNNPIAAAVSFPWFRQPERILYNTVLWLLPFAGFALALAAIWLGRKLTMKWIEYGAVAIVASIALIASSTPVRQIPNLMASWTAIFSTVGGDEVAAFEYLASVTEPGEKVLTDLDADGSLWMYALEGVDPLFLVGVSDMEGIGTPQSVLEANAQRKSLAINVANYRLLPEIADRLAETGIRYIYYDETGFYNASRTLSFQALRTDPAFVPVFEQGAAHVYRIDYDVLRDPRRFMISKSLVEDGTFDAGLRSWAPNSQAGSWSWDSSDGSAIVVRSVSEPSVLYAMRTVDGRDPVWDEISVSPDDEYAVSFEVRPEESSTGSLYAGLSFFDAEDNWILTSAAVADLDALDPGSWHRFERDIQPPDGAVRAVPVIVAVDVDGPVRIDNLDLRIRYSR